MMPNNIVQSDMAAAEIKAVIAQGLHLLPFRTEKLNLVTPMVLPKRESRKRPPYREARPEMAEPLFFMIGLIRLIRLMRLIGPISPIGSINLIENYRRNRIN